MFYSLLFLSISIPVILGKTSGQLCRRTAAQANDGNWYCAQVQAITYKNISQPGQYNRTIRVDPNTGLCHHEPINYSGFEPPTPLIGELSMHLRGPMNVSQLAVYRLPNAIYSKRALKRRNSIRALKRWTTEALDVHSTSVWIYPDDTSVEGCAACSSTVAQMTTQTRPLCTFTPTVTTTVFVRGSTCPKTSALSLGHPKSSQPHPTLPIPPVSATVPPLVSPPIPVPPRPQPTLIPLPPTPLVLTTTVHVTDTICPRSTISNAGNPPTTLSPPDSMCLCDSTAKTHVMSDSITLAFSSLSSSAVKTTPSQRTLSITASPCSDTAISVSSSTAHIACSSCLTPTPSLSDIPHVRKDTSNVDIANNQTPTRPPDRRRENKNAKRAGAGVWDRVAYYTSTSPATATGFAFLANLGDPQKSGTFDYAFGNSLGYVIGDGRKVATTTTPFDGTLATSEREIAVFTDKVCDGDCEYARPDSTAHYGWDGPSKAFLIEFRMDHYDNIGSDQGMLSDAPAWWFLNAAIPRILQYGNDRKNIPCSCWSTGCGEFDAFEILGRGEMRAKSTIHRQGNLEGGDSNYFLRPVGKTIKFAVVFHNWNITARVLDDSFDFGDSLTPEQIRSILAYDPNDDSHSLFAVGD